jgi:hypothetical protein
MDGTTLRDGIFALHTRRFGSVAEVMIRRLIQCGRGRNLFHDLYDDAAQHRIEVKFSRVQKAAETFISEETVLKCIEEAASLQRMVPFNQWQKHSFDCNIQQVKRAEFDVLYYGLFFADCVVIFRIKSVDIGSRIQYSDKQHKGNVGEGQFHIHQHTLQIHLDNYLYQKLTYDKLLQLLC